MKRSLAMVWLTSVLECVLPRDVGEAVTGDLAEEFQLRLQTLSQGSAIRWLVWQVVASVPGLLLLTVRRWSLLKSLAAAFLAFGALLLVEPRVEHIVEALFEIGMTLQMYIKLLVGFAACGCAGVFATWMHRGSAMPLGAIGAIVVASMVPGAQAPPWYMTAFLFTSLVAPIIGGATFIATVDRAQR